MSLIDKIAECIAGEILPIQKQVNNLEASRLLALEILYDNGLIDEYLRQRRKQIISAMLMK